MRRAFIYMSALALAGAVLGGLGCKKKTTDAIAVIPKGTTHEFWKSVHAGAVKAAAELGVNVIWKGPLREDDREDQIKVVESFTNMHVRGIVLAPLDDTALAPVVTDAVRAGIPVVAMDSSLKSDDLTSFVATDNYRGGRLAGEHLASLVANKGKVMMLRYAEGSASTADRERGFLDAMNFHNGIEVVSANQYGGVTTESAFAASENLLAAHKNPDGTLAVQGIFCPNESTAFGMLRALEDAGLAGKVAFVGFDSSPKMTEAMAKGHLDATVVQDPIKMGYLAVKAMADHLAGRPVEKRIDTGATLITRATMGTPEAQALLNPDFKKWLKE
ncbi:MAG TPA: substrate-binding domain-containing protein [Polyangia bacterium]|nr:substrate-binding domain-containing protein [Polyangia bacterium]